MHAPICETQLTRHNAALSMTKVPHLIMFGVFCLLVVAMFDRVSKAAVLAGVAATAALGLLVELEEGATRTGHCRLTDVLPDVTGALVAGLSYFS